MSRDRGIAAIATAGVGIVTDLLAFGGDFLIGAIVLVLSDIDLIVSFLAYLSTLAAQVAWLPEGLVEQAYAGALVVLLLILGARLVSSYRESVS